MTKNKNSTNQSKYIIFLNLLNLFLKRPDIAKTLCY